MSDLPEVHEVGFRERARFEVREGHGRRERLFSWVCVWRRPRRSKSPGEQSAPTQPNPLGSSEEYSFFCGIKPLERRYKVFGCANRIAEGFVGKRRSGETFSKGKSRPRGRKKALKGESPECWELKEVPQGHR